MYASNGVSSSPSALHSHPPIRKVSKTLEHHSDSGKTYQAVPVIARTSTTVKAIAPLRSLGFKSCKGGGPPWPPPAEGSPLEVPPVAFDKGPFARATRLLCMTSNADICSPTPYCPSQPGTHHLVPHVTPSEPPEHDCAAASAEVRRSGIIVSAVQGASWTVAASQREK